MIGIAHFTRNVSLSRAWAVQTGALHLHCYNALYQKMTKHRRIIISFYVIISNKFQSKSIYHTAYVATSHTKRKAMNIKTGKATTRKTK